MQDTFLSKAAIKDNAGPYKKFLLTCIPDFCIEGGMWYNETKEGVTFKDSR
jgi:hypothetical protein